MSQEVAFMLKSFGQHTVRLAIVAYLLFSTAILQAQTQTPPSSQTETANGNQEAAKGPSQGALTPASIASATQSEMEHAALTHLIESIEPYFKKKEIKGTATLTGSTTMLALGKSWSDRFRKFHPEVAFTRGVDGSEAALKALSEDPSVIAGVSRPLTDEDTAMLKKGKCKDPLAIIVALDPLALYVHKDNPIAGITPQQLESIFHAPGGPNKHAALWGDVGVAGEIATKPVRIHSRSETSGTTTFIKQMILQNGEMAKESQSHRTNEEVCKAIGGDLQGVGICGFGEVTSDVKAVPLVLNGARIPATEQAFLSGQYPFVRPLLLVIDKSQLASDGGLREAVLRYILSRDGQLEAVRAGFFPLDPAFIRQELDQISGPQMR